MGICANCFKDVPETYLFCPFCGCPTGDIGLKQCGRGHIVYESWKNCPFCGHMENLGKSFINCAPELPEEALPTELLAAGKPGGTNIAENTAVKQETAGDEIDDKTRFETFSGYEYPDKTVLESEPGEDRTILDEGINDTSQLPPFFAWLVFPDEEGKPMHDVRLTRPKSIIGKGSEADVRLQDDFASKLHALIHFEDGNFFLSDLGSTNHTWLNEKKIMIEKLTDGDRVRIGHRQMIFKQVRRSL